MKTAHKQYVRSLIMELLYDEKIRTRMSAYLDLVKSHSGVEIDEFEAMEIYEQEVERINRLFCYPQQAIEDAHTNPAQEGRTMHCPQVDATTGYKRATPQDAHTTTTQEVSK